VCGYCAGVEDEDGNQLWEGDMKPRPGKKRTPKAKPRDLVAMQARLERYEHGEKEWVGPRTWGDVVEKVRVHGVKFHGKEEQKYALAKAKQAAGGHHLYDTVAGNAVVGAPMGPELVNLTIVCCAMRCGLLLTFQVWGSEMNLYQCLAEQPPLLLVESLLFPSDPRKILSRPSGPGIARSE
jgi:hypothetical protein